MFGVRTVEVPSVIPVRWSAAPSYFERTWVISFDYGEVDGFEVPSREECERMSTSTTVS